MFFFGRKWLKLFLMLFMMSCLLGGVKKAYADPPPPPVNPITIIPNPFDPNEITDPVGTTTVSYYLYNNALLWLRIYDLDGNLKYSLETPPNNYTVDPVYGTTGGHSIVWDGSGTTEYGIYPYRMDDIAFVGSTSDTGRNVFDAVVDPENSQTLWMTDTSGLWQSTDGGVNWTAVTGLHNSVGPHLGIAISSNGERIYVIDKGAGALNIHYAVCGDDPNPRVCTWDLGGTKNLSLWTISPVPNNPHDIACTGDGGTLYVVDRGTGYLYQATVSCTGDDCSAVNWTLKGGVSTAKPTGVAVDPNLNNVVFVADSTATKVYKSTDYGQTFITVQSLVGSGNGAFYSGNGPYQISIDTNGYYWVSDLGYHRVQEFDSDNKWVMTVGGTSSGTGDYQFNAGSGGVRLGVFLGSFNGQSYLGVASYIHHRIKKYAYLNFESDISFQNETDDPIWVKDLDDAPPSQITDLVAATAGSNSIKLTWTAPSDDACPEEDPECTPPANSRAKKYYLKCAKTAIDTDYKFDHNATLITGVPTPKKAGSSESLTVEAPDILCGTGLESNTTYYFAIKSEDDHQSLSLLSNLPPLPPPAAKTGLLWEWNMVSCPLVPSPSNPNLVFKDITGIDPVWIWDWYSNWSGAGDTDNPDYDGEWTQVSTLEAGKAFFLLSYNTLSPTHADGSDFSTDPYSHSLRPGWNLIGNPYRTSVNLSDCNVYNPGADEPKTRTYAGAVTAGWIENAIYIWNGTTYIDYLYSDETDPAKLEIWKGYWIKAYYSLDLIINKP